MTSPTTHPALKPRRPGRPSASPTHGKITTYKKKHCRCTLCTEAWRVYKKLYRRRRKWTAQEIAADLRRDSRYAESELVVATIRKKS